MKPITKEHRYFYVDETGDPNFYGKGKKVIVGTEGCSRTFGLGFLRTTDPETIRAKLRDLHEAVTRDRYLAAIPSMQKTALAFHAKDDCPEVRKAVYDCLDGLSFSIQIVMARKIEHVYRGKHKQSQDEFYNDLTSKLFQRQLHLATENTIVFARRGDKTKQHTLKSAVEAGVQQFRRRHPEAAQSEVNIDSVDSRQDPLLQAADYGLWAVQRAFEKGDAVLRLHQREDRNNLGHLRLREDRAKGLSRVHQKSRKRVPCL